MRKISLILFIFMTINILSQEIPQNVSYTRIYDFIDELANQGTIEVNTGIKPYSRAFIAQKLKEAYLKSEQLNNRQKSDLKFFVNDYALELDTLPKTWIHKTDGSTWDVAALQPGFQYNNQNFKCRVMPLLGMTVYDNSKGAIVKRWYGADLQATITDHLSMYANLRDYSMDGSYLDDHLDKAAARLAGPTYLQNIQGMEYKEADYGGDFSEMRGGVIAYCKWGSVGLVKENLTWGESYSSSNILSGHNPSFPMVTLKFKPVKWLELNYIHGWLVSDVIDSSNYYIQEDAVGVTSRQYRPRSKYIAANMLTVTPIRRLNVSFGNSIIYAENAPQAAFFIPFAFYKSLDHLMTKGIGTENQNSQVFAMISSRNIKHLHLYGSFFCDEFQFDRLKGSSKERNPYSYQLGGEVSNWPLQNVSLVSEFTRTNIINYKHSIASLTYASNEYCLGHYLGDNSQEALMAINYKPIRSLQFTISYTNARHYNEYKYYRENIKTIISQEPYKDLTWQNDIYAIKAIYEIVNNCYASINVEYNNARSYNVTSTSVDGEERLTAKEYLNLYTPAFYQGKNWTTTVSFSFGF